MRDHGVRLVTAKLDAGDYSAPGSNLLVDTKQGLQEVAGNIGRDHARFSREVERARAAGCRLVILVEEHPEYNADRGRMGLWLPEPCRRCRRCDPRRDAGCARYRSRPMQGATVARTIGTMEERHGFRFEFCRKADTARRICEILGIDYERGTV